MRKRVKRTGCARTGPQQGEEEGGMKSMWHGRKNTFRSFRSHLARTSVHERAPQKYIGSAEFKVPIKMGAEFELQALYGCPIFLSPRPLNYFFENDAWPFQRTRGLPQKFGFLFFIPKSSWQDNSFVDYTPPYPHLLRLLTYEKTPTRELVSCLGAIRWNLVSHRVLLRGCPKQNRVSEVST